MFFTSPPKSTNLQGKCYVFFLYLEDIFIANPLTNAIELSSAIKSNILQQTLVKPKLNLPAKAHHINATVKEAGCNFDCICLKFLYTE